MTLSSKICIKIQKWVYFLKLLYNARKCYGKIPLCLPRTTMIPSRHNLCMKRFKKVTHCLFDMDGTIIDSEKLYHAVVGKICDKYGKHYTKEMQTKLYGTTDHQLSECVVNELRLPISVKEFERALGELVNRSLSKTPEKPGAERLMSHLYEYNVPMALATNSTERTVRLHAAAKPRMFGMFTHMVSVSDPQVDRGKPHPDLYLVAASRFPNHPKPIECVVFEDSEIGVQAAVQAGMQVVMIPDNRLDRSRTRQATMVIRSLRDFQPELFGLPPFNEAPKRRKSANVKSAARPASVLSHISRYSTVSK